MLELLPFLTSLSGSREAVLSMENKPSAKGNLLIYYDKLTDEQLQTEVDSLSVLLKDNQNSITILPEADEPYHQLVFTTQGSINDSFKLFNVKIHHLVISDIQRYLESQTTVGLIFKNKEEQQLDIEFSLELHEQVNPARFVDEGER